MITTVVRKFNLDCILKTEWLGQTVRAGVTVYDTKHLDWLSRIFIQVSRIGSILIWHQNTFYEIIFMLKQFANISTSEKSLIICLSQISIPEFN